MDLAALIALLIRVSVMLTVIGLSLQAPPRVAAYLFRRPRQLLRSLLSMDVVMPLVAVVLAAAFPLQASVKIALVALAVSPVPPMLLSRELKAGGHAHYTIGLFVAAGLLSIFFVPVAVALVGVLFGVPLHVPITTVSSLVTQTVLAPLALGLLVHYLAPAFALRVTGPVSTAGGILLIVAVVPVLVVEARAILALIGNGTLLAMVVFSAVGLLAGHALGGPRPAERLVLAMATASRHPGVAAAIAATYAGERATVPAVALYLVVSSLATAVYVAWYRRRQIAAGGVEPAASKRSAA
jgi:BASS family bile acid:Na+ symporter